MGSHGPLAPLLPVDRTAKTLRAAKRQLELAKERAAEGVRNAGVEAAQAKVDKVERRLAKQREREAMARAVGR